MCDTWNWRSSGDFNCSLVELTSEMVPIGWGVFQFHDASQMIFYSCFRLQGLQDLQGLFRSPLEKLGSNKILKVGIPLTEA